MNPEGFQTKLAPEKSQDNKAERENIESCTQETPKNKELQDLFNRLWTAADELRANSKLRSTQYSTPVLGILFLRYAHHKFEEATRELEKNYAGRGRPISKLDYQAQGAVYLAREARYDYLLELPEGANIGKAIDDAMRSIEEENEELRDVLPKVYTSLEDKVLINLLKIFHNISPKLDRDIFGKIYEYFIGKFAMTEGQRGGEFYTPTSIVRLIVDILEPYKGRILDPACGSGGMFVQSAKFVKEHLKNPYSEISVYGQEKAEDTVRLCKMNLAIHGLSGEIKQGNTYYEDTFNMRKQFDFVVSNPPFNVNNVDKESIKDDPRFQLGIPSVDNANYLWIQIFDSMLNGRGRAGFVMANSANDAGSSELAIRKKLIENDSVEVIVLVAPHFFYTVGLAVTLWFLNKDKIGSTKNKILFIDAKNIFQKIDRAHVEFTSQQIEFISNIVRLYRGREIENNQGSLPILKRSFPSLEYQNVLGLCNAATLEEIKEQNYSLTSGRYVHIEREMLNIGNFAATIKKTHQELSRLSKESNEIETEILRILSKLGEDS